MRIDRMKEGYLYRIKPNIWIETDGRTGPDRTLPVLRGWRNPPAKNDWEPFIYLGHKQENWSYHYQHTNRIHYVMWRGTVWVMDNQFAKHIIPVWDGEDNGQQG